MAINPADLFKLAEARRRFRENHPKFGAFLHAAYERGLKEGTVIEMKVTPPDGEPIITNLRVQESDLELLSELMQMGARR